MSKQFIWMLTAILTLCGAINVSAQTSSDTLYVGFDQLPDAGYFLPAPPDSSSAEFLDDIAQWQWGKTIAPTARGARASRESQISLGSLASILSQALELDTISAEQTPAIFRLMAKSLLTGVLSTLMPKEKYMRKRPFMVMNETAWGQYDDPEDLRGNGSYPSGHTATGWAAALAMAEMWPALQDTILRRGFEYGENRIIVNAHWQSERFLNNPVDTASARYMADIMLYWSNKPLRNTSRGDTASIEAEYSVAMMQKVMGEAIGITISDLQTPAITRLLSHVLEKASETADRLKVIRFRKRPFVQLGEPSAVAGDEEKERGKSSFPSGHTNLGWAEALVMAEVAPEHQDEILRRGYEYGHNRLIVGYHWYTDIEASRQLASALVARLHADPTFLDMIAAARAEYANIVTGIVPESRVTKPSSTRIYTLDGRELSGKPNVKGIYISNHEKVFIK